MIWQLCTNLLEIESTLREEFGKLPKDKLDQPGVLSRVVPARLFYERMLEMWRSEVSDSKTLVETARRYQHAFAVAWLSSAFYEYAERTLWPTFAESVGLNGSEMRANRQGQLGTVFLNILDLYGFRMLSGASGQNQYVNTAVFLVGVPLSFWADFLALCRRLEYRNWAPGRWPELAETVHKRGLRRFLHESPKEATLLIKEVLDLKSVARNTAEVEAVLGASYIRPEYVSEVPETLDFLFPHDPAAQKRWHSTDPVLRWNSDNGEFELVLPPREPSELPASWIVRCDDPPMQQVYHADETYQIVKSGLPPADQYHIKCQSADGKAVYMNSIDGCFPVRLYDMVYDRLIALRRREVPMREYSIISAKEITLTPKGLEVPQNQRNRPYRTRHGHDYYVTVLEPTRRSGTCLVETDADRLSYTFASQQHPEFVLAPPNPFWVKSYSPKPVFFKPPTIAFRLPEGYDVSRFVVRVNGDQLKSEPILKFADEMPDSECEVYELNWTPSVPQSYCVEVEDDGLACWKVVFHLANDKRDVDYPNHIGKLCVFLPFEHESWSKRGILYSEMKHYLEVADGYNHALRYISNDLIP